LVLLVIPIQEAIAVNEVSQIIKVTGSLVGGVEDEEFLLPSAVTDQNKTIIFMSVRHIGDGEAKQTYRSWDFVNNTAIRFHGSSDVPASNLAMDFVAYLVEFTATSDMVKQNGTLIVDGADVNKEFVATLSPIVNTTNSFFTFDGLTMDHSDVSWGSEEFGLMRVLNDTTWGYEPFDAPNTGNTEVRFSVVDWNNVGFVRQNGTGTLLSSELLDTIVPSPAVNRNHTMILVTTQIEDELDATADEHSVTATLNPSNSIEIERDDAICPTSNCEVNYSWELLTFPTTFANVTHGLISETNATAGNVEQREFDILPSPVIVSNTIAIGTVQTPLGLGQSRSGGGGAGSWDRNTWTIELFNTTHVRAIINDGQEESNLTYQVIEFLSVGVVNLDILDIATAVDLSQNKIVTKVASDIAGTADTVSTGVIFVVNLDDTGTVTDVTSINVSKLAEDAVNVGDDPEFNITKLLTDSSVISDNVITSRTRDVSILDTATVNDLVIFNVTKQFQDVASGLDNINKDTTKIFLDTTSIVDSTDASLSAGVSETDITSISDSIIFDATKTFEDISDISDDVVLLRTRDLVLIDIVDVNDPSILFIVSTVVPNGTGTPAGSGGGIPSGTPFFQRLVGLSIISELFNVEPADRVPSDFIIETFGNENLPVIITNIQADQQFASWFEFSSFPDTLLFDTAVDTSRTFSDPARFKNSALDDFVLNIPSLACDDLDPFVSQVPCVDPIIYEAPVTFTFKKGGVEFRESHIVTIDATQAIVCDELCQLVDFMTQNYWWLAGIIIVFMMMYFLGGTILKGKPIRTIRRVDSRHFTSFEAGKPKKKFKRGKR
jgi:hypothetical protein